MRLVRNIAAAKGAATLLMLTVPFLSDLLACCGYTIPYSLAVLYDDDYSTCDNLGWFMRFYDNHKSILEAISTLYLNRNVIFDKWY